MASEGGQRFRERTVWLYASALAMWAVVLLGTGIYCMLAPLFLRHWPAAAAVPLGLAFALASVPFWRYARRWARVELRADADGITVTGPRKDHHLRWDEVRELAPAVTPGGSALPVIVLTDGETILVQALRVDGLGVGGSSRRRSAHVARLCHSIEALRPAPVAAGAGVR